MAEQGPPQGWGPPQQPGWGPPPSPRGPKPPDTRPWFKKKRFIIPLVVVALFFILGIIGAITGPPDETGTAAPTTTAEPAPTVTNAPSTVAPTTAAPSTAAPTTAIKPVGLRQAIGNALGSSNRGKDPRPDQFNAPYAHTIVLRWSINDNLTEGLVKSGARLDVIKILKAVRSHPDWASKKYPGVTLIGTFKLVNDLGEESEDVVIRAHYDRATINRMNFNNIDFHRILNVADPVFVHPTFVE